MKRTVLITCPTYPPFNSGLGNVVQRQARALVEMGCSVVVATGGQERKSREDVESGAAVEEFNVSGADCVLQPLRGDVESYIKFLKEHDFDVVLLNAWQTWSTDVALRHLDQISGRIFLYSNCVSTNLFVSAQPIRSLARYLAWRPYWFRMGKVMEKLDGLIFVSDQGCDSRFDDLRLAQKLNRPYSVVPNPLSIDAAEALASSGERKREHLMAVGSYDWFKGHDFVLRCYAGSKAKNRIKLKIFGQRFTSYTEKLRELADQLGLKKEFVVFHENTPSDLLLEEYGRAMLLLSGSHTECQPLVLLDAMASGTPFVARACGCIPFLAGGAAVKSTGEAVSIIDRLLEDESDWSALSTEGVAAAKQNHHPEAFGENLQAVIFPSGQT